MMENIAAAICCMMVGFIIGYFLRAAREGRKHGRHD